MSSGSSIFGSGNNVISSWAAGPGEYGLRIFWFSGSFSFLSSSSSATAAGADNNEDADNAGGDEDADASQERAIESIRFSFFYFF
jgi:hypothetical protein